MAKKDLPKVEPDGTAESCRCTVCRYACQHKPGWFLPGEAEKAAALLRLKPPEFFKRYLGVDYWGTVDAKNDTYLLAPAIKSMSPGTVYPGDPRGECVFFDRGECGIHSARPHECRKYIHGQTDAEIARRHEETAKAWGGKGGQSQIKDLLGCPPEEKRNQLGELFDLLGMAVDMVGKRW